MGKKMDEKIKKYIEEFFTTLGISANVSASETDEEYNLVLDTEDSGMIIGYHGETLESLQLVLSLALAKKTGVFKRVSIEVGDYKKNREEWLRKLASDSKEKAISQQREVVLSDLKAWERRVIHLMLSDDKEVVSESSGEGRDRVLVVRPK